MLLDFSYFTDIPYSIIREIAEKVAEINAKAQKEEERVIDLSMGQNFIANSRIILEKIRFLKERRFDEPILYEASLGAKDIRELIVKNYYRFFYRFSEDLLSADNIMITDGAYGAVRNAMAAILRPGDIVVFDRVTFRYFVYMLIVMGRLLPHVRPFIIPANEDTGFVPPADEVIECLQELKTAHPDKNIVYYTQFGFNPMGCFRSERDLREIVRFVENEPNIFLINDIVYHLIRWERRGIPLASILADEGLGIVDADTLSKPYGVMGLRVGALITRDKELFRRAALAQQYIVVSPNRFATEVWRVVANPENLPEIIKNFLQKRLRIWVSPYVKGERGQYMSSQEFGRNLQCFRESS